MLPIESDLTPAMRAVLDELPRIGRFVLNGAFAMPSNKAKAKVTVDIPDWHLHDLRRSFTTGMARIGVAPHLIERCLNHAVGGVAGIYQRHDYLGETAAAFEQWSMHIETLVV